MNIGAFLVRGFAWGCVGLTLLAVPGLHGMALAAVVAGWLLGLAGVAWITASGTLRSGYSVVAAWLFMALLGLLLNAIARAA